MRTVRVHAVTHAFIALQVCGGAYPENRGRYRDTGLQLCYKRAKEGIAHGEYDPMHIARKFCVTRFGHEIGIIDIKVLYDNCRLGFREMQRSISIPISNHCKSLKVCWWTLLKRATSLLKLCLKCHFLSISGLSEYLGTEICTSRQKRFSLVTFVDTPGLVDGDMKYPFDVDQAILWLGVCLSWSHLYVPELTL